MLESKLHRRKCPLPSGQLRLGAFNLATLQRADIPNNPQLGSPTTLNSNPICPHLHLHLNKQAL